MFKTKRGMSPLIATILLIAFAVSIGAVIMSYGNAYYAGEPTTNTDTICKEIEIYEIGGEKQICIDDGKLNYILLNKGYEKIEDMQILASYKGEKSSVEVVEVEGAKIIPGQPYNGEMNIDYSKGNLAQVQFLFRIKVPQKTCFLESVADIQPC